MFLDHLVFRQVWFHRLICGKLLHQKRFIHFLCRFYRSLNLADDHNPFVFFTAIGFASVQIENWILFPIRTRTLFFSYCVLNICNKDDDHISIHFTTYQISWNWTVAIFICVTRKRPVKDADDKWNQLCTIVSEQWFPKEYVPIAIVYDVCRYD